MSFVLTRGPIRFHKVLGQALEGSSGGAVLFLGRVRADRTPHGPVRALYYEAFAPLAEREMARLERAARRRWNAERVVVVHRLGTVAVGEVSVAVAVGAPHRAQAFAAARFLIDRLKDEVPIWKSDVLKGKARPARSGSRRRRPRARRRGRAGD